MRLTLIQIDFHYFEFDDALNWQDDEIKPLASTTMCLSQADAGTETELLGWQVLVIKRPGTETGMYKEQPPIH